MLLCKIFVSTALPKIKTVDQNLVTDAGKPFVMMVPYDAYPRAEAEWFFNGFSLPRQNIDISTDRTDYRMKDPKKSDQGQYKIVIRNKHGKGQAFINLDVIGKTAVWYFSLSENTLGLMSKYILVFWFVEIGMKVIGTILNYARNFCRNSSVRDIGGIQLVSIVVSRYIVHRSSDSCASSRSCI